MKSMIKQLIHYERYCDKALLSEQFRELPTKADEAVKSIGFEEVDPEHPTLIQLDIQEPRQFASGYIAKRKILAISRSKLEFMAIEQIAKPYGYHLLSQKTARRPGGLVAEEAESQKHHAPVEMNPQTGGVGTADPQLSGLSDPEGVAK